MTIFRQNLIQNAKYGMGLKDLQISFTAISIKLLTLNINSAISVSNFT